jgi:Lrp/AsnC family leucine-responsive transcriptional regulator
VGPALQLAQEVRVVVRPERPARPLRTWRTRRPDPTTPVQAAGRGRRTHHQHDHDHRGNQHDEQRHGSTPSNFPPVRHPHYDRGDTRGSGRSRRGEKRTESAIDAVDRRLIELLRANGRASYAELARQVGLSSPAVHERVGKLEAAGVITGYRADVDPGKVGLDVTALVGVIESDAVDDTGIEEALRAMPQIEDCWRVAGSEGYVLKVRVSDIPTLEATISALNRVRGVARTRTTVVLSTKWEGRHG